LTTWPGCRFREDFYLASVDFHLGAGVLAVDHSSPTATGQRPRCSVSRSLPGPTANTVAALGFLLGVSGSTMPPAVTSSARPARPRRDRPTGFVVFFIIVLFEIDGCCGVISSTRNRPFRHATMPPPIPPSRPCHRPSRQTWPPLGAPPLWNLGDQARCGQQQAGHAGGVLQGDPHYLGGSMMPASDKSQ